MRKAGAKLLFVGDDKQLGAIGAGGMFRTIVDRTRAPVLSTVRRFRDTCPEPAESIVAQAILTEPTHPLHALVGLMTQLPDCEAFDEVAPDVFATWWAQKGARVGRRRGNEIVWANGDVTAIPAFAGRWEGDAR